MRRQLHAFSCKLRHQSAVGGHTGGLRHVYDLYRWVMSGRVIQSVRCLRTCIPHIVWITMGFERYVEYSHGPLIKDSRGLWYSRFVGV